MEIERRFLINNLEEIDLSKYKNKRIVQDYLYSDRFSAIRKRCIIANNESKYIYTIKTGKANFSVNEIEKNITEDEYNSLKIDENSNTIDKIRYYIPYENGLTIELDVFKGIYEGIIFAEIEFESEKQAQNSKLPKWFGAEISSKITNSMMAKMNAEEMIKMIKNCE